MATTPTDKPTDNPAKAEPKQRPVKRPPRPKFYVPRGIAWIDQDDATVTIRVKAGGEVEDGVIPAELVAEYLERGDIVPLTTH